MKSLDLMTHAGKEKFWSRAPGLIVDKNTGKYLGDLPTMLTIQEWYCTLTSTIGETLVSDMKNPKEIRAGFIPFLILEHTPFYKPLMVNGVVDRDQGVLLVSGKEMPIRKVVQLPEDMMYLLDEDGTYIPLRILGTVEKGDKAA